MEEVGPMDVRAHAVALERADSRELDAVHLVSTGAPTLAEVGHERERVGVGRGYFGCCAELEERWAYRILVV